MDEKLKAAREAMNDLAGDESIPLEDRLSALEELEDDLRIKINNMYDQLYPGDN